MRRCCRPRPDADLSNLSLYHKKGPDLLGRDRHLQRDDTSIAVGVSIQLDCNRTRATCTAAPANFVPWVGIAGAQLLSGMHPSSTTSCELNNFQKCESHPSSTLDGHRLTEGSRLVLGQTWCWQKCHHTHAQQQTGMGHGLHSAVLNCPVPSSVLDQL